MLKPRVDFKVNKIKGRDPEFLITNNIPLYYIRKEGEFMALGEVTMSRKANMKPDKLISDKVLAALPRFLSVAFIKYLSE